MTACSFWTPLLALATLGLALATAGCSTSSCDRDPDSLDVPLATGSTTGGMLVGDNTYVSGPFTGPYPYFPPGRTITFDHHLCAVLEDVQIWLAFSPNGSLATAAGNEAEFVHPTDGGLEPQNLNSISIYNDTCSTFYVRIVATKPAGLAPDPDCLANADGGVPLDDAGAGGDANSGS